MRLVTLLEYVCLLTLALNACPSSAFWQLFGDHDPTEALVKAEKEGVNEERLRQAIYPHTSERRVKRLAKIDGGYLALGSVYDNRHIQRQDNNIATNTDNPIPDIGKIDAKAGYHPLHLDRCKDHRKVVRWAARQTPPSSFDQRYDMHMDLQQSVQHADQARREANVLHKVLMVHGGNRDCTEYNLRLRDELFARCKVNVCKQAERIRHCDPAYKNSNLNDLLAAADRMKAKGKRSAELSGEALHEHVDQAMKDVHRVQHRSDRPPIEPSDVASSSKRPRH